MVVMSLQSSTAQLQPSAVLAVRCGNGTVQTPVLRFAFIGLSRRAVVKGRIHCPAACHHSIGADQPGQKGCSNRSLEMVRHLPRAKCLVHSHCYRRVLPLGTVQKNTGRVVAHFVTFVRIRLIMIFTPLRGKRKKTHTRTPNNGSAFDHPWKSNRTTSKQKR